MKKSSIVFLGKESFCETEIKLLSKDAAIELLSIAEDREQIEAFAKIHSGEVYELVMSPILKG